MTKPVLRIVKKIKVMNVLRPLKQKKPVQPAESREDLIKRAVALRDGVKTSEEIATEIQVERAKKAKARAEHAHKVKEERNRKRNAAMPQCGDPEMRRCGDALV